MIEASPNVAQLFVAALGGGFTVKLIDIFYQEYRHRVGRKQTSSDSLERHLDPLLKAADELVGKLRSLAESDFKAIAHADASDFRNHDFGSIVFLFGRFWAEIERIRHKGMSVDMAKTEQGQRLQSVFTCLESRRVRLVERVLQRAAGEAFLRGDDPLNYIQFVEAYETDSSTKRWMEPLATVLSRTRHTRERQRVLQYGTVVHALIDSLDPTHMVTRERPSMSNKLSKRSIRDLKFRVFGVYLKFVSDRQKYIGPPRSTAR